ncbi:MAG: FIST N-terminal domain-containing protein [Steroidobacteraceae bacterium]
MTPQPAMPSMRWASVSATDRALTQAVAQATDRLLEALGGCEPDLVLVFVSSQYRNHFSTLPGLLRREFDSAQLVGCLGVNVIGAGRESANEATVALVGTILPGVKLQTAHLEQSATPPLYANRSLWDNALNLTDQVPECQILLTDPYSFNTDALIKAVDRHYPHCTVLGGLASGMEHPGTACLLLNERVYNSGALCLSMSGNLSVATIVAQGCRPIGEPMFANATHENLIMQLDGKVPRDILTDLYQTIERSDRKLFTDSLFLGVAMEPQREQYQAGDFLIRTILGLDPDSGALLINTHLAPHSVVQLHLRDAKTSATDLQQLLSHYRASSEQQSPRGVLLFSCLGRGTEFYGAPDHDSNAFKQVVSDLPIGGFFCNGEIGPVRGVTHLHGYTSVFGIFSSKQ